MKINEAVTLSFISLISFQYALCFKKKSSISTFKFDLFLPFPVRLCVATKIREEISEIQIFKSCSPPRACREMNAQVVVRHRVIINRWNWISDSIINPIHKIREEKSERELWNYTQDFCDIRQLLISNQKYFRFL